VGCRTYDTIAVVVHPFPAFELGSSISICQGDSATFSVDNTWSSVVWSDGSTDFNYTTSTLGWVSAEVFLGNCSGIDSARVDIVPMPDFSNVISDFSFCLGDSAILEVPFSGQWSTGDFAASIWVYEGGVYTYTYNLSSCSSEFNFTITTDTPVELSIPESLLLCEGAGTWVDAGWSSTWNTGETANAIYITEPGTYTANATNGTCSSSATVIVESSPLPLVAVPESSLICEGKPFRLENLLGDIDEYLWSNGDTTYYTYIDTAGWYSLTATNSCGSVVDSVFIDSYACNWDIFAPNTITPNGDGINDLWKVEGFNIQNVHIWLYDQRGNLAYESYRLDEGWVPEGVSDYLYAYRIEVITQQQENYEVTGHLLVLR
jgi:gliding motility-associated-like protein